MKHNATMYRKIEKGDPIGADNSQAQNQELSDNTVISYKKIILNEEIQQIYGDIFDRKELIDLSTRERKM